MHILAVWWKRWRDPSHQEEEDSKDSVDLEAEIWNCKGKQFTGEPVAQNSKAWEQPLAHGASSLVDKESQKDTKARWRCQLQISPHTSHFLEAVLLHGQENLWKTTWRSYGRFGREFGYLENVHGYNSWSSSSSRKRLWHAFETGRGSSAKENRIAFQGHRKADQWPDRNRL